jgi:hypothetical protein
MFESSGQTVLFLAIFIETLSNPNADIDNLKNASSDTKGCKFRHGIAGGRED